MATEHSRPNNTGGTQHKSKDPATNREADVRKRFGLTLNPPTPIDRPEATLPSITVRIKAPSIEDEIVSLYITISYWKDVPFEVFLATKDPSSAANAESLTRLASLWLRSGGEIDEIVRQLRGISIGMTVAFNEGGVRITSMGDALAHALDHNRNYHSPLLHTMHRKAD